MYHLRNSSSMKKPVLGISSKHFIKNNKAYYFFGQTIRLNSKYTYISLR